MPYGDAGDVGFYRFNARLRPDQLQPGELAASVNGRMGFDGAWQVRKGVNTLGSTVSSSTLALTVPWYAYGSAVIDATGASRVNATVTVTTTGNHGFTTNTLVGIAGLTGSVDPNGNRLITVTGSTTFTFTITGAVGSETYTGPGTAGAPYVDDGAVTGSLGSCLFSDPSNSNSQYIIIATNSKAVAVALSDGTQTDISYPSGIAIASQVTLVQAFDKVFMFRDGATALEWDGDLSGSPAFVKVSNGDYTAPTYFNTSNNTVITDGVVTVTETSHGLAVGDIVYVVDAGSTELTEGLAYQIATVPTGDTFTVNAQIADLSSHSVVWTKQISKGLGFTHMPAPPWGVYHERRLFVPYFYTTTGTPGSETVTDRGVRDEILISDIGDTNTYDRLQNSLRITSGVADYLVALHPFTQDNMVALNRNSIHLISGCSGDIDDISITLITNEVGCLARKTVLTVGNQILFLSDNGVYAATFADLYNLRGRDLPLSEPIKPWMDRINKEFISNCIASYWNNRYYLAVPLDDSEVNNAIFVYNFLNQGWESIDIIDRAGWDVTNLISGQPTQENRLYAINELGGVHIYEDREDDNDNLFLNPGVGAASYNISATAYATTRGYTLGTMDKKKWTAIEMHLESSDSNASNGALSVIAENTDSESEVATISELRKGETLPSSEDAILGTRIGNKRAYSLQVKLAPSAGRPKLRGTRTISTLTQPAITQST